MLPRSFSAAINRTSSDPFVRTCLTHYAFNLSGKIEVDDEYLWILLRLLPGKELRLLCDWMKSMQSSPDNHTRYLKNPAGLYQNSEEILMDISRSLYSMTRKEFERHVFKLFAGWCNRTQQKRCRRETRELKQIQKMFGLSDAEKEIVCLLYCIQVMRHFAEIFNANRIAEFVRLVSAATRIPSRKVQRLFSGKSALLKKGLIVYQADEKERKYRLIDAVMDYLSGVTDVQLKERFVKEDKGRRYDLASFNVDESATAIIQSLLLSDKPCNLLLYGRPGTGKTEYAKAVIASVCGKPCFFQYGDPAVSKHSSGYAGGTELANIRAALNLVPEKRGVLIVDEADSLLNTRYFMFGSDKSPDKSRVNYLLDESSSKTIWITNDTDFIEESVLRRFAYSLKFKHFSRADREHIWHDLVRKHPLRKFISPDIMHELASSYPCNAAGIASALESLKAVVRNRKTQDVKATLEELLRRHTEAIGNQPVSQMNLLTDRYDLDSLNLDTPPAPMMASLKSFMEFRQAERRKEGNINLLFWGRPGTGKTELAKYLAKQLSIELVLKRASDLISMWVGQTEQNIRDAFEEAEKDNAVLLIDEADSFFINRQTAARSWEVSQTNELLTQMENYKGILICCTNLLDHLDSAVLRRFAWKIQFRPLTEDGKIRVFAKFFPGLSLEKDAGRKLAAIAGLTPGQIKAVWQKHRFVPATQLQPDTIIAALENEARYESGQAGNIGFGC